MNTIDKIKAGDVRSISRLITLVERREPEAIGIIKALYPLCGNAHVIGVTGAPGVGKSCLVSVLAKTMRQKNKSVGILAVDPSSPLTGGAFLGDRARMTELNLDREVFIRSMASRGSAGGLSAAVNDTVDILDAAGKDIIIIETVGIGQGEIEICNLAHSVLLVLMPGYGDIFQAMKAGIMEVADILVVNKADKPGADETVGQLTSVQNLQSSPADPNNWQTPILKTSALESEGLDELFSAIFRHFKFITEHQKLNQKNRERRTGQFLDILTRQIRVEFMRTLETDPGLQKWVKSIENLDLDPYSASERAIEMIKRANRQKGPKL
jgi:LAO/AO transport system kinase